MVPNSSSNESKPHEVRLDRLIGNQVVASNNRHFGRVHEFRAERRGKSCVITGFVIGTAGLLERFNIGIRLLFGQPLSGYLARWDQIDLSTPGVLKLTCSVDDLQQL